MRNITERERAEQTIREAEGKFRILVEQSLTGIYILQGGRFVYANPRLAEILGYAPEELAALPFLDLVVPEDRPLLREDAHEQLAEEGQNAHYTVRCFRKDGSVIYTEVFISVIDYRGRPAFIGTMLDVTEQREAQESGQESERRRESGQSGNHRRSGCHSSMWCAREPVQLPASVYHTDFIGHASSETRRAVPPIAYSSTPSLSGDGKIWSVMTVWPSRAKTSTDDQSTKMCKRTRPFSTG